jgi:hypothetical protein
MYFITHVEMHFGLYFLETSMILSFLTVLFWLFDDKSKFTRKTKEVVFIINKKLR